MGPLPNLLVPSFRKKFSFAQGLFPFKKSFSNLRPTGPILIGRRGPVFPESELSGFGPEGAPDLQIFSKTPVFPT